MKQSLETILQELYSFDPTLKEQEKELRIVIQKLLVAKPDVTINPQLISQLKNSLLSKTMKQPFSFNIMTVAPWAVAGVAMIAVVVTAVPSLQNRVRTALVDTTPKSQFVARESGAFGSLASLIQANDAAVLGTQNAVSSKFSGVAPSASESITTTDAVDAPSPTPAITTRPQSGGGSGVSTGDVGIDSKMAIWIPQTQYRYVYDKEIDLSTIPSTVYRRIPGSSQGNSLFTRLAGVTLPMMSLGNIPGGSVSNFSFSDDNGFMTTIDLVNNMASMYVDYSKKGWDYYNTPGKEITLETYPSDDSIITIASNFLDEYGINREQYGAPILDTTWRGPMILAAERGEMAYVPQDAQVRFPLQFEGKSVYESWGNAYGISVSVNLQRMEVTGAYEIVGLNFETSDYAMTSDQALVKKLVERGGIDQNYYFDNAETKLVDVPLGDPEIVYTRYYTWEEKTNTNKELYIPALRFPVLEVPKTEYYYNKESVIIPLAQEILDKRMSEDSVRPMPVEPMPFVK